MDKVKLTKGEAFALGLFMQKHASNEAAIKDYLTHSHCWFNTYEPLKEMGFDKFVKCLFFGYESEKTNEERLLDYYNDNDKMFNANYDVRRSVIRNTLRILGIEISGIN